MKCDNCGCEVHDHAAVVKLKHELDTAGARILELEYQLAQALSDGFEPTLTKSEAMERSGFTDAALLQAELDEIVTDEHNAVAANINNDGIEAQLEYLERKHGTDWLEGTLDSLKDENIVL